MRSFRIVMACVLVNFCLSGCSGCKNGEPQLKEQINKEVSFKISGLDGQGEAEGNLKREFLNTKGVMDCGIDYLASAVVVKFDSNQVNVSRLREILLEMDGGRYKLIEEKISEPEEPLDIPGSDPGPAPEDPSDIPDDMDQYDNHG